MHVAWRKKIQHNFWHSTQQNFKSSVQLVNRHILRNFWQCIWQTVWHLVQHILSKHQALPVLPCISPFDNLKAFICCASDQLMHWLPAGPSAQSFQSFKCLASSFRAWISCLNPYRRSNGCSRKLFIMSIALTFTSNGFRGITAGQGPARSWGAVASVSCGASWTCSRRIDYQQFCDPQRRYQLSIWLGPHSIWAAQGNLSKQPTETKNNSGSAPPLNPKSTW